MKKASQFQKIKEEYPVLLDGENPVGSLFQKFPSFNERDGTAEIKWNESPIDMMNFYWTYLNPILVSHNEFSTFLVLWTSLGWGAKKDTAFKMDSLIRYTNWTSKFLF